jgi:hypothetical protein
MFSPVLFLAAFGFICQTPLPAPAAQAVPDTARFARKTLDTMTVTGYTPIMSAKVDQKSIEKSMGIIDDLGALLVQKPGVTRVPEAGSLLAVNGEGPFDNMYLIRGIPVFPPSDFPGHTFADKSVVSLALPTDINFYTSRLVSQYSGASGSIVTLDPYALKTAYRVPRPEAAISYSTLTTDLSVNAPFRRDRDRYQASFSVPNDYSLAQKGFTFGENANLGYGMPMSAWNCRTIGEQNTGSVKIEQLAWVGMNEYGHDIDVPRLFGPSGGTIRTVSKDRYPWAILALSAGDSLAKIPWNVSIGGSQQYFLSAQSLGPYTPVKRVQRDNAAVNIQGILYADHVSSVNAGLLAEHLRSDAGLDIQYLGGTARDLRRRILKNNNAQLHIGYSRQIEKLRLDINSIQGFYYGGRAIFIDPGFSLAFPALSGEGLFSAEINSAPADIRLLPGSEFSDFLTHTCHSHMTMRWNLWSRATLSVEGFAKWKDRIAVLDSLPQNPVADAGRKASQSAVGANAQIRLSAGKRISFASSFSTSRALVKEGKARYFSDWDCPWASQTALSFSLIPEKMFLYCIGTFSAGFPYRDLMMRASDSSLVWSRVQSRIDDYKCVDLKFEWRQPTDGDFITEYDGFIYLQNIFNTVNIREYQWTMYGKYPIRLQPLTINLGVRLNFRFLYW